MLNQQERLDVLHLARTMRERADGRDGAQFETRDAGLLHRAAAALESLTSRVERAERGRERAEAALDAFSANVKERGGPWEVFEAEDGHPAIRVVPGRPTYDELTSRVEEAEAERDRILWYLENASYPLDDPTRIDGKKTQAIDVDALRYFIEWHRANPDHPHAVTVAALSQPPSEEGNGSSMVGGSTWSGQGQRHPDATDGSDA